jgi:hypothetical protein
MAGGQPAGVAWARFAFGISRSDLTGEAGTHGKVVETITPPMRIVARRRQAVYATGITYTK